MDGYIKHIGLCNFDTKRTDEICTVLGPGAIVSNQVQVRNSRSDLATRLIVSDSFQSLTHVHSMEWATCARSMDSNFLLMARWSVYHYILCFRIIQLITVRKFSN